MILLVLFVIFMVFALAGGVYAWRPQGPTPAYGPVGSYIFLWLCVAILGWVVFDGRNAINDPAPPAHVRP